MIQKHRKSMIFALSGVLLAALSSVLVLSACKSYAFNDVTVYHGGEQYISPSALALQDGNVYVSDATANKVYKLDADGAVTATQTFSDAVNSVYVDGEDVYALVGGLAGEIHLLDSSLKKVGRADTQHTPNAAVVAGEKIYVANRFSNSVSVYNKDLSGAAVIKLDEGREPFALAYAQGKVFVACHLPGGAANADSVAANLIVIDPDTQAVKTNIELINGTGSVKDIAVSSDGNYVYLSNLFARYTYPTSQLDRGWINTNGITIVDAVNEEVYAGVLLDSVERGASNPWGLDVIGEGENAKIVCAISGLAEISVVNEKQMFDKIAAVANDEYGYTVSEIVDRVEFLAECSARYAIGGNGLRDLQLVEDGNTAYAYMTQYFDGAIVRASLTPDEESGKLETTQYLIGSQGKPTTARLGEILWYDGTYCYQSWESCASCHPDARADGFNWDNLNDGLGNPKQAKSMVYSHRTPPEMITGARETAELAVRKGMQFIQFNTMEEEYLCCIDDYLKSLKPVQSPYLNRDGTLTEAAKRGEKLFEEYNCNTCHSGPFYTDLQMHKSTSLDTDDTWETRDFDTPTLIEIWRTAPYMFNGSAATMQEAVEYFIRTDGKTATKEQINDLSEYILSIGDSGELYGVEQVFFDRNDGTDDLAVTLLVPGRTMTEVTVRKQWDTDKKALVTVTLYDEKNGKIGDSVYAVLSGMETGDYASFKMKMQIPEDLKHKSYYEITITNADNTSEYLATTLRVYYIEED